MKLYTYKCIFLALCFSEDQSDSVNSGAAQPKFKYSSLVLTRLVSVKYSLNTHAMTSVHRGRNKNNKTSDYHEKAQKLY